MTIYSGNYIGNIVFFAGDDASLLISVTGSVDVMDGATLTAPVLVGCNI